jgi:hypothetical protein
MSRDSIIAAGRIFMEAGMESTCIITRKTGSTVDAGGNNVDTFATIYSGPCRLRYPFVRPQEVVAEGQSIARDRAILSLPAVGNSANVRANDLAVVTISPVLDPGTTVKVRVETPFAQTHATARRFPVEVSN